MAMRARFPTPGSVHNVHDLAGSRVDQRGAAIDDDVLIFVGQGVFGKFARLQNIRYERPNNQFKVGRTLNDDRIGFHIFSDHRFLFRRDDDSLGCGQSGPARRMPAAIVLLKVMSISWVCFAIKFLWSGMVPNK